MAKKILFVIVIAQLMRCSLYAQDDNALKKLARGSANILTALAEVPRQIVIVNREQGDIAGAFWGPLKGVAYFMTRMVVGAYEVTTCLIPPYQVVVEPEFLFVIEGETR